MNLLLAMAAVGVLVSFQALADGPVHVWRTLESTFDAAAGEVCDFAYHQEARNVQNIKRWVDADGNPIGAIRTEDLWVLHQNAETGYTLTEVDHYTVHWSYESGDFVFAGNGWHLRDEDGRLVLVKSGRYVIDIETGDLVSETPNVGGDFADMICPALGGAPAQ